MEALLVRVTPPYVALRSVISSSVVMAERPGRYGLERLALVDSEGALRRDRGGPASTPAVSRKMVLSAGMLPSRWISSALTISEERKCR